MQYDSDKSELLFFKCDSYSLLNSKISNLPKNKTFYWLIGHSQKPMSVTILK